MANYFPLIANVTGNTGLFSELPVGGNLDLTSAGIANLAVGNLQLTGGSNGQFLQTNGSGNLSFATVSTSSITNGNSNVSVQNNANVNISAVGNANVVVVTGTGLVTANISTGNVTANGNIAFTGANVSLGAVGNLKVTGGSNGQMLKTDGSGNLAWATVDTFQIQNGNSNVVVLANGNVGISSTGVANVVVVTSTGANVKGTANITGNTTVGGELAVTGNTVITGNLTVNGTTTTVNSTTLSTNDKNIVLANNATTAGQADGGGITINGAGATMLYNNAANRLDFSHTLGANVTGSAATVTTGSQPNITSVGTLSSLSVSGLTTLADVANVSISGGNSGQVLRTNGSGGLSWSTAGTVTSVGLTQGAGITITGGPITTAGNITVQNSGVISLSAGNGITVSSATGNPTVRATVANVVGTQGTVVTSDANGVYTLKSNVANVVGTQGTVVTSDANGVYTLKSNVANVVGTQGTVVTSDANGVYTLKSNVANIIAGNGIQVSSNANTGVYTLAHNLAPGANISLTNNSNGVTTIATTGILTALIAGTNILLNNSNANATGAVTISAASGTETHSMKYASENVTLVSSPPSPLTTIDVLSNSIHYITTNSSVNRTVNITANGSSSNGGSPLIPGVTNLNSLLSTGQCVTTTLIMTNGLTGAIVSQVQVDGNTQTINWVGNVVPTSTTNSIVSFTFTVIKTANITFKVLGAATRYGTA